MKNKPIKLLLVNTLTIINICIFHIEISAQQMTDYNRQVFPVNHALNMPIDNLPVHPNSNIFINTIGSDKRLHPDFGDSWDDEGTIRPMGIPYNVVGSTQALKPIEWTEWDDESDPGPWPIPDNPFIEGVFNWKDDTEGDRHMLIVDSVNNILYETGNAYGNSDGSEWEGGCGAKFDLNKNDLRTIKWTSADAAGLPIFPLLIRYDEVEKALNDDGLFHHAIRFTTDTTKREYIWPARHYASSYTDTKYPPMGLRFRLKADYDISGFSPRNQVILRSMKKYGLIVSDNGKDWLFQGTHDSRWDNEELDELKNIRGSAFEAVDISEWMKRDGFNINSAKVPSGTTTDIEITEFSAKTELLNIYPNPFSTSTKINYTITETGNYYLKVFDITGREVVTLFNGFKNTGQYTIEWDGTNHSGMNVESGVYFYQISTNNTIIKTCKMFYLKK